MKCQAQAFLNHGQFFPKFKGKLKRASTSVLILKLDDNLSSEKINFTLFFLLVLKALISSFHMEEMVNLLKFDASE